MSFILLRRLLLLVLLLLAIHTGAHHLLQKYQWHNGLWPLALNITTIISVWALFSYFSGSIKQVVETLELGVKCFEDNDFSITIQNKRHDELGRIIDAYNNVAQTIRQERMNLYQRELLLDTIIQQTPVALILTDHNNVVVYCNQASITLFKQSESLEGMVFSSLIEVLPASLKQATVDKQQGLYSHQNEQHKSVYYLNCQAFSLNNSDHYLYLYKNMSAEISRQEVDLWKNAIRLMSHELNNSLAPIASLTNSAKDILQKPQHADMLPDILDTISQRTAHLHTFIEQYAKFARLPKPSVQAVSLDTFVGHISRLCQVNVVGEVPDVQVAIDSGQMEQVLINLLKNGKESGSAETEVSLAVSLDSNGQRAILIIADRGPGMSEAQLQQALLPFFSTKPQGTGLGLTLCNEIVTSHGGEFKVANREGGGLQVRFSVDLFG